jgi:hypothetical protein
MAMIAITSAAIFPTAVADNRSVTPVGKKNTSKRRK